MTSPSVAVVVQARMSSTRLPGKMLLPLAGAPAIVRMLERLRAIPGAEWLVVATSVDASDDPLAATCKEHGFRTVRGPLDDVLARFALAVPDECDTVVRLTGDCPLIDPDLVETHLRTYVARAPGVDYVSNAVERTYPDGLDVEVFGASSLREANARATTDYDREHVTPWIQRHTEHDAVVQDVDLSELRWTLDTRADYDNLAAIYDRLYAANPAFTTRDVYGLLVQEPSLLHVADGQPLTAQARDTWIARLRERLGAP